MWLVTSTSRFLTERLARQVASLVRGQMGFREWINILTGRRAVGRDGQRCFRGPQDGRAKCRFVHFIRDVKFERGRLVAPEDLLREQDDLARRLGFSLVLWTLRELERDRWEAVKRALLRFHAGRTVLHLESVEDLLLRRLDSPALDFLFFKDSERPLPLARWAFWVVPLRGPKVSTAAHLFWLHN